MVCTSLNMGDFTCSTVLPKPSLDCRRAQEANRKNQPRRWHSFLFQIGDSTPTGDPPAVPIAVVLPALGVGGTDAVVVEMLQEEERVEAGCTAMIPTTRRRELHAAVAWAVVAAASFIFFSPLFGLNISFSLWNKKKIKKIK
jgi:hypothetical protein